MNHIELFAGCGGLSLGLESEGFDLYFANELSPMASETFAYNILGVDLEHIAQECDLKGERVFWINSRYARNEVARRLTEPPETHVDLEHDDLSTGLINDAYDLEGSLIVGGISHLNRKLESDQFLQIVRNGPTDNGLDLVSGGPPCQSFSSAGLREKGNARNRLPADFVEFIKKTSPRIALLENVLGILLPFSEGGHQYFAWFEVAKAFCRADYVPICMLVNARFVGTAQNRPRFILLALRYDIAEKLLSRPPDDHLGRALQRSLDFYQQVKQYNDLVHVDQRLVHRVENGSELFQSEVFAPLVEFRSRRTHRLVNVRQAIDDLPDMGEVLWNKSSRSSYVKRLNQIDFRNTGAASRSRRKKAVAPFNHNFRSNGPLVRARFLLYQRLSTLRRVDPEAERLLRKLLRSGRSGVGTMEMFLEEALKYLVTLGPLMTATGDWIEDPTPAQAKSIIHDLHTKKHSQYSLVGDHPAPAALSIPDDACHYRDGTLRTLTIREMARIQSFPDWFRFRSKETTGGPKRRYEVPQYTQVGNAVPPLLGKALGKVCRQILTML